MIGMHLNHFEKHASVYDERAEHFERGYSYQLTGYYQSWKYFSHIESDIRKQFTFRMDIQNKAHSYLRSVKRIYNAKHKRPMNSSVTFIGVHVRRGDIVNNIFYRYKGYVAAEAPYLLSAMNRMTTKFENALFIVCSDDTDWCEQNLNVRDVFFSPTKNPSVDLAILSSCNHSIITTGSFGWWSAWLARGETIYYKNWPRPNTELFDEVNHTDYFPATWIPM
ncbi:galactoside 2-alpha-L-fucosyltransferase Sec1-like [Tubulanus polymorphus]|uniref:galactoside 2-alpha-L-fucosyltransferase Sec1-like n=1 Tax=Tubulanus polymorphus TaxID=672921 RepID=UPI003DA61D4B